MRNYYNKKVFRRNRRKFGRKFKPRSMKAQMLKPMMNGKVKQPVHYFTRFMDYGNVTYTAGTTETLGVIYLRISDLPNYTEFTNLYDSFKITAIQANFLPLSNITLASLESGFLTSLAYNRIFTVVDYNDRNVAGSIDLLRQYGNCRFSHGNVMHRRFAHLKPTITIDQDSGSGSGVGIGNEVIQPWVSTASTATEFIGIKYGMEHNTIGSNIIAYKIELKVYLQFKGVN